MQSGSSGPYCLTQFGALEIRRDGLKERDAKTAEKIRVAFAAQYEESDFSNAFLTNHHISFVLEKLLDINTGDMNIPAEVIQFVITWDDEKGYDGSAEMLKVARNTFLFNKNKVNSLIKVSCIYSDFVRQF